MAIDRIINGFHMTPKNDRYFESATRKLLKKLDSMGLDNVSRLRAKNLVLLFRDSFRLPDVKYATFAKDLGKGLNRFTYDSDGFCRVASINFQRMMGSDWQIMFLDNSWSYGPHHYLMHTPSKTVFDLTFDQYTHNGIQIPYDIGRQISCELEQDDPIVRFAKSIGIENFINQKD